MIFTITFVTYIYLIKEEQKLLNLKYTQHTKHTGIFIKNLIEDKKNATLIMAIALSKNEKVKEFIDTKNYDVINYNDITDELKENTDYKNVWIQIIDLNGNSLYRSWTDIKSDLKFRKDLNETLIEKKISTSISVGRFDMTIKGRSPIYKNNHVIGFIEVITHFNSISEKLKSQSIDSIVITDKKYKNTIKFPYSNIFINDYYIANKNVKSELVRIYKLILKNV
ncbi:MAG: hypothetical protein R2837_04615 [Aliarcobacter sp.]